MLQSLLLMHRVSKNRIPLTFWHNFIKTTLLLTTFGTLDM